MWGGERRRRQDGAGLDPAVGLVRLQAHVVLDEHVVGGGHHWLLLLLV